MLGVEIIGLTAKGECDAMSYNRVRQLSVLLAFSTLFAFNLFIYNFFLFNFPLEDSTLICLVAVVGLSPLLLTVHK